MPKTCRIEVVNGVPRILADGEPVLLMCSKNGLHEECYYRQFEAQGFRAHVINCPVEWTAPAQVRFDGIHERIQRAFTINPAAHLVIELHTNAPEWWQAAHPEEVIRDAGGQAFGQSLASTLWQRHTAGVLAEVVRQISAQPYGERIVLCFVGSGHTWEWFNRGVQLYGITDRSRPMQEYFRQWLRERYRSDEALREAWDDPRASLAEARPPSPEEEQETSCLSFRHPRRQGRSLDYFRCIAAAAARAISLYGRTVKENWAGEVLFGAFYGHLFDWIGNPDTAARIGHLALGRLLDDPAVDVLAGPNSYINRDVGFEASFTSPVHSYPLHGKLWLSECDTRTVLADPVQQPCGRPETLADSLAILQRDFANVLTHPVESVWFSLLDAWYDHPQILEAFGEFHKIAERARRADASSRAEIAVFADEESCFFQTARDAYVVDPFIAREPRLLDLLPRIGAPCDFFLLQDAGRVDPTPYRLALFANAWCVPSGLREAIRDRWAREGRTLLWFYAPGFVAREGLSTESMAELTGMRFGLLRGCGRPMIRIDPEAHPLVRDGFDPGHVLPNWIFLDSEGCFGVNRPVGPLFQVEDEGAIRLGHYAGRPETAFAVKEFADFRSVYIGAPLAPPGLLRKIARYAGVHIYLDAEDILYANASFLAVHTRLGRERTLRFKKPCRVRELFGNGALKGNGPQDAFALRLAPRSTALLYIGETPWEKLKVDKS